MTNNTAPTITLSNGVSIPALGLGTSPMNDSETERATIAAIEAGEMDTIPAEEVFAELRRERSST